MLALPESSRAESELLPGQLTCLKAKAANLGMLSAKPAHGKEGKLEGETSC